MLEYQFDELNGNKMKGLCRIIFMKIANYQKRSEMVAKNIALKNSLKILWPLLMATNA